MKLRFVVCVDHFFVFYRGTDPGFCIVIFLKKNAFSLFSAKKVVDFMNFSGKMIDKWEKVGKSGKRWYGVINRRVQ